MRSAIACALIGVTLAVLVALPPFLGLDWQNVLIKILIASLFALAYNLLSGQAGLLSFGHAAYYAIGAFAVLHLMKAVENGLGVPTPLLPLAGALAGLLVGLVAGYFATMRSGVYFALVTLAIAELLHSLAPHLVSVFGGEAGIASMRMPSLGVTFGSLLEVYYLTLAWVVLSVFLLWAYTRTPFGRLTLALHDNEQRVSFLGYNAHFSKMIVFAVSAMFSGIAGGLQVISNETANYGLFSLKVSSDVVVQAYVGGVTLFFGPVVGAAVFTLFAYLVSDLTRSWLFYQGLIFVLVMLYAPTGIGGMVQHHHRRRYELDWARLAWPYALGALGGAFVVAGVVFVTESVAILFGEQYVVLRRTMGGGFPPFQAFGVSWSPTSPVTWILPAVLLAAGLVVIARVRGPIAEVWAGSRLKDLEEPAEAPNAPETHA